MSIGNYCIAQSEHGFTDKGYRYRLEDKNTGEVMYARTMKEIYYLIGAKERSENTKNNSMANLLNSIS